MSKDPKETGSSNRLRSTNEALRTAKRDNTVGTRNTATRAFALESSGANTDNTAAGHQALQNDTGGSYNTATGSNALASNTTGMFNAKDFSPLLLPLVTTLETGTLYADNPAATLTASARMIVLKKNEAIPCRSTIWRIRGSETCTSETWAVIPITNEK